MNKSLLTPIVNQWQTKVRCHQSAACRTSEFHWSFFRTMGEELEEQKWLKVSCITKSLPWHGSQLTKAGNVDCTTQPQRAWQVAGCSFWTGHLVWASCGSFFHAAQLITLSFGWLGWVSFSKFLQLLYDGGGGRGALVYLIHFRDFWKLWVVCFLSLKNFSSRWNV